MKNTITNQLTIISTGISAISTTTSRNGNGIFCSVFGRNISDDVGSDFKDTGY